MAARDRLSNFTEIPFIYGKHPVMPRLTFGVLILKNHYSVSFVGNPVNSRDYDIKIFQIDPI